MTAITITQITVPELQALIENILKEALGKHNNSPKPDSNQWFDLKEVSEYIPGTPSQSTIYRWHGQCKIPSHKKGKKLFFLKSEIDAWLLSGKSKSQMEIDDLADAALLPQKRH